MTTDLTSQEQTHVRTAMRFLRTRCGTWRTLSRALRLGESTVANIVGGRPVGPVVAFRVARFAKVTVDDVLTGRFPAPGTCPYCGHLKESTDA